MRTPKLRRNGDGRAFAAYPGTAGRRCYFGVYGTDEAEQAYNAWLADLFASRASGDPVAADRRANRTLGDLAADYLRWAEQYYAGSRELANVLESVKLLLEHSGEMRGSTFGPNALRRFQGHLVATGRFARTTINAHINRVRRFVKWCQSRELVPRGLSEDLASVPGLRRGKTSARETSPVTPVPWVYVRATLPFLGPVARSMVTVQYWSGSRPGEICRMRASEIETTGPVWFYRPRHHKTGHRGHGLTKALPTPAQAALQTFLEADGDGPLFRTVHGNAWKSDSYGAAVTRAVRKAQAAHVPVPHWTPHQLRHSILTEIRDRFGVEAAQAWAGHARPDTTAIYTRQTLGLLTRIASEIAQRAS